MNSYSWNLLFNLSVGAVLVTVLAGFWNWYKLPIIFKIFIVGQFLYFLAFLASFYITVKGSTIIFSVISVLIDIIIFWVLYNYTATSKKLKIIITFGACLSSILLIFSSLLNDYKLAFSLKNVSIILSSILIITEIAKNIKKQKLASNPVFWIASAKLFVVLYSTLLEFYDDGIIEQFINIYFLLYAIDLLIHILLQAFYIKAINVAVKKNVFRIPPKY